MDHPVLASPGSLRGRRVLIAAGGPVGLPCAWLLGRHGLPVVVFDDNSELQADPRATTTHPATLDLLEEDELADDMARVGLVAPIFQFWDRPSGQLVAEFDHAILKDDTRHPFVVQCEQFKTAKLLLERLRGLANVHLETAERRDAIKQDLENRRRGWLTTNARKMCCGVNRWSGWFSVVSIGLYLPGSIGWHPTCLMHSRSLSALPQPGAWNQAPSAWARRRCSKATLCAKLLVSRSFR